MAISSFFNGLSINWWPAANIYNQYFPTTIAPPNRLTAPLAAAASVNTYTQVDSQFEALNGLYSRAFNVLTEADQLSTDNTDSVFYQQTATSSDSNVAVVNYFDRNNYLGAVPDSEFDFDISATAEAQINMGTALDPDASSVINAGTNQFTLTVGADDYHISVNVNPEDTNEMSLEAMAQAINDARSGVEASVVDGLNDNIQLKLLGDTGEANGFSLADTSGNAVTSTGADNTTQAAADASFSMNGNSYTQANNAVFLLDGHLQVDLYGVGEATITVGPDTQGLVDSLDSLAGAMNDLTAYLGANQYLDPGLASEWSEVINRASTKLSQYGLALGADSQFELDADKLTAALDNNSTAVQEALGGINGLATTLQSFARRLTSSPGAMLLESPPFYGYGAAYLRSLTSAASFRIGSSLFWRVV